MGLGSMSPGILLLCQKAERANSIQGYSEDHELPIHLHPAHLPHRFLPSPGPEPLEDNLYESHLQATSMSQSLSM